MDDDHRRINWPMYNLLSMIVIGFFITIGVATNTITTTMMMNVLKEFGLPGIILGLWYTTKRSDQRNMQQYHDDVIEMKRMYTNNVRLVEKTQDLAVDLKDIVIMNTQAMTTVCKDIECVLDKRKGGSS